LLGMTGSDRYVVYFSLTEAEKEQLAEQMQEMYYLSCLRKAVEEACVEKANCAVMYAPDVESFKPDYDTYFQNAPLDTGFPSGYGEPLAISISDGIQVTSVGNTIPTEAVSNSPLRFP